MAFFKSKRGLRATAKRVSIKLHQVSTLMYVNIPILPIH